MKIDPKADDTNPNLNTDNANLDTVETDLDQDNTSSSQTESPANLESIGASLIDSMPDVQQHAIEQNDLENDSILEQYAHLVDKNNSAFDPKLHKTKRDGTPTVSKLGKLMLKPASAKQNNTKDSPLDTTLDSGQLDKELTDIEKQQCAALGKISANSLFAVGRVLGGEEWAPIKSGGYDEAAALESAFNDYYLASGKTEMSPKLALSLAIGSYAIPRFTKPITQAKTKSIFKKIHGWWHQRKGKKNAQASQKAEQVRKDSEKKEHKPDTTFYMDA